MQRCVYCIHRATAMPRHSLCHRCVHVAPAGKAKHQAQATGSCLCWPSPIRQLQIQAATLSDRAVQLYVIFSQSCKYAHAQDP